MLQTVSIGPESETSAKRRLILDAAARVFLSNGYEAASMDLIASESGAGRRTLYNRFKSKKVLFDAVTSALWRNMPVDLIVGQDDIASHPEDVLRRIGVAIGDFWAPEEAVAFLRLIIREGARFPELTESFFTSGRDPARGAVTRYMRQLIDKKVLDISDCDLAVTQFIDLIIGPVLLDRLVAGGKPPSKERRRYIADEAVATILCRYRLKS